jgi:hypothetical protein
VPKADITTSLDHLVGAGKQLVDCVGGLRFITILAFSDFGVAKLGDWGDAKIYLPHRGLSYVLRYGARRDHWGGDDARQAWHPTQLQQLAATIADAGFLVERPEMCWSAARIYDRTYLECLADIDAAAAQKEHGVTAIVVLACAWAEMRRLALARDAGASKQS